MTSHACHKIKTDTDLELTFTGPAPEEGALPALFYFALSGHQSLTLDPFNQPVARLEGQPVRVFSLSLPGHGSGHDPHSAIAFWALHLQRGDNLIQSFVDEVKGAIDFLVNRNIVNESAIAASGLSRGGFAAACLAANDPRIKALLAFAPLTDLTVTEEFSHLSENPLYKLETLAEKLIHTQIRLYIGNHDTRVGTDRAFGFVQSVVKAAIAHHIRSPKIELIISPSVGHKGHGTPPPIFQAGADWVAQQLLTHKNK